MTTRDRVIGVVAQTLEIPEEELGSDSHFIDDLGTSSLDIVNLIWRIEEVFALGETPESDLERIETIGDVIELVDLYRSDEPSEVGEVYDILFAADHAGVELKAQLLEWVRERDVTVMDLGPTDTTSVDYPSFAQLLARRVARGEGELGVLVCGTGIGMSIAANKIPGVRAAHVGNTVDAKMARRHNDANVLCMGGRILGSEVAIACLETFLDTSFDPGDDGRHRRRVNMMCDLERE